MLRGYQGRTGWLIAAGVILLMLAGSWGGLFESLELGTYDMFFRWRGAQPPSGDVVIVAMDDASIAALGRLPWPRQMHAKLLERLREARVVAFDVLFDAPAGPEEDQALAAALAAHSRVVLATQFTFEEENGEMLYTLRQPLPEFLAAAAGTGFINFPTDQDNVARRLIPADAAYFEQPYPAFSLAVALAERGLTPADIGTTGAGGTLQAGGLAVPVNGEGQALINFWGPGRTFPTYSYVDVLEGKVPAETFKSKIVLIGVSSPAEQDLFNTPFTRGNLVLSGALPSPGVELHASALESMRQGAFFRRAGRGWNLAGVLALGLLVALITSRRGSWLGLALALLLAGGWSGLVWYLWQGRGWWLNLAAPLLTLALVYLVTTLANLIQTELEKRRVQGLFGRYVNESVVAELLRHPEMLELGGKRQEVTILFSDIRGFTSYSEGKQPEEVVGRLNEYLAAMTETILDHGGMLDKYLGDGIMAVFGAPLVVPDHAGRALASAREMMDKLAELNAVWASRGEPTFAIGVGLNSGPVLVGNVGGSKRMEYTAIGEEVNLASRLESLNKEHHTNIILSERTLAYLAQDSLAAAAGLPPGILELGEVQVRGLVQPVKIYTVAGD